MSSFLNYEPFYDIQRFLDDAGHAFQRNPLDKDAKGKAGESTSPDEPDGTYKPRMDIEEDPENNVITATFDLPGLKKDDVQIDVQNNRLTVSGENSAKSNAKLAVHERHTGKFHRSLPLPEGVNDENINAHLDNGVLSIQFPKTSAKRPNQHQTITID